MVSKAVDKDVQKVNYRTIVANMFSTIIFGRPVSTENLLVRIENLCWNIVKTHAIFIFRGFYDLVFLWYDCNKEIAQSSHYRNSEGVLALLFNIFAKYLQIILLLLVLLLFFFWFYMIVHCSSFLLLSNWHNF